MREWHLVAVPRAAYMHRMMRATSGVQPYDASVEKSLERLDALAKLLDSSFFIPGTKVRMGLDGIIGLVPVVGDLISGALSSYIIWEARRLGASRWVLGRMATNALIDTAFGAIPLVGDAFDVVFRTNVRNLALLRKHLARKGLVAPGSGITIEGESVRLD